MRNPEGIGYPDRGSVEKKKLCYRVVMLLLKSVEMYIHNIYIFSNSDSNSNTSTSSNSKSCRMKILILVKSIPCNSLLCRVELISHQGRNILSHILLFKTKCLCSLSNNNTEYPHSGTTGTSFIWSSLT